MVDVVVGMDALFLTRFFEDRRGTIRYDFVDVHIELGPAAGHPHGQGKIAVEFPF